MVHNNVAPLTLFHNQQKFQEKNVNPRGIAGGRLTSHQMSDIGLKSMKNRINPISIKLCTYSIFIRIIRGSFFLRK